MATVHSAAVLQEMEAAILSGHFKPRERLIEMDLIAQFGVSRTVIREVLKALEARGLVRTAPYRGAVVADLNPEEVEEIYSARTEIEKIAVRLVVKNIQPEEVRAIKQLAQEVEEHLRRKTDRMIEMDGKFHRAIFQACRNQYLYDIINFLRTKAHIIGYNAWSSEKRISQSIREHREIVRAIEQRDRGRLEKLIIAHLAVSKNSYLAQLKGTRSFGFAPKAGTKPPGEKRPAPSEARRRKREEGSLGRDKNL